MPDLPLAECIDAMRCFEADSRASRWNVLCSLRKRRKVAALQRASLRFVPGNGEDDDPGGTVVGKDDALPELIPDGSESGGDGCPKKMQKAKRRSKFSIEDAMAQQAEWEENPRPRVGVGWGTTFTTGHKSIAITEDCRA